MQTLKAVWSFVVGQEPTATVEVIRQILTFMIIMHWIRMTTDQQAALFLAMSVLLMYINRKLVTPVGGFGVPNPKTLPVVLLAGALAGAVMLGACAKYQNKPPDAVAAHTAADVEQGIVALQTGFMQAYQNKQVPFQVADAVMQRCSQATNVAQKLSDALKFYHNAVAYAQSTTAVEIEVRRLLTQLERLVAEIAGVKVPDKYLETATQLIMAVQNAVASIRQQFPTPSAPPAAVPKVSYMRVSCGILTFTDGLLTSKGAC